MDSFSLVAAFEIALNLNSAVGLSKEAIKKALEPNASTLLTKFENMAKKRQVIFDMLPQPPLPPEMTVESPIVLALEDLYTSPQPDGRTYVLYAPPTQGKTCGARYFLQDHLPRFKDSKGRPTTDTQGIMITGPGAQTENYFAYMAKILGVGDCKGWMYSLIAALMPDPRNPNRLSSILLLDNFNTASQDNRYFLEALIAASVRCGFYTVVITQEKEFANTMSAMNKGMKIAPLPGAVGEGSTYSDPKWNDLVWEKSLLCDMVDLLYPGEFESDTKSGYTWITHGMTPTEACWEADKRTKKKWLPSTPERKKRKYTESPEAQQP